MKYDTVKFVLSVAAVKNLQMMQFDARTTFLYDGSYGRTNRSRVRSSCLVCLSVDEIEDSVNLCVSTVWLDVWLTHICIT